MFGVSYSVNLVKGNVWRGKDVPQACTELLTLAVKFSPSGMSLQCSLPLAGSQGKQLGSLGSFREERGILRRDLSTVCSSRPGGMAGAVPGGH